MRKFTFLSVLALLSALIMTSCLGKTNYEESPISPGLYLYQVVMTQNNIATDPLGIATGLNILLETIEEQKAEDPTADIDVNTVTVTIDEQEKNLKNVIFNSMTEIKVTAENEYTITYYHGTYHTWDYQRSGSIVINTNGWTFSSMQDAAGDDVNKYWTIKNGLAEGYSMYTGAVTYYNKFSTYMISAAADQFYYSGTSTATAGAGVPEGKWEFDFYFKRVGGTSFSYEGLVKSNAQLQMYGYAGGTAVYAGAEFTYDVKEDSPLIFKPSCSSRGMFGGAERVKLTETYINEEAYPDRNVKVIWRTSTSSDCGFYYQLSYNGYTYDLETGETTL